MKPNANTKKQPFISGAGLPSPRFSGVVGSQTRGTAPEWRQVSSNAIILAVACVQAVGGAIMFGSTSDGGALVISLFLGDDRYKFYFKSEEEAGDGLAEVAKDIAEGLPQDTVAVLFS